MRSNLAYLIGAAMAVMPLLSAAALSAQPQRASAPHSSQVVRVADNCPPGTHWEDAGYVHDGKWRNAGCKRNNGVE